MNDSRHALKPETDTGSKPNGSLPSARRGICLLTKVWTPFRTRNAWTSESTLVDLISDLIVASDGSLSDDGDSVLIAHFESAAQAFGAAKRIQWSLLEFSQHRPEMCLGAAALIIESADPLFQSKVSASASAAVLDHATPTQILATAAVVEQMRGLPGLQARAFTPLSEAAKGWRGRIQELAWTTPPNLESAQQLLKQAAQSLTRKESSTNSTEPTADFTSAGTQRSGRLAPAEIDHRATTGENAKELPVHESSLTGFTVVVWWSIAGASVLLVILLLLYLTRSHPKRGGSPTPPVTQTLTPRWGSGKPTA